MPCGRCPQGWRPESKPPAPSKFIYKHPSLRSCAKRGIAFCVPCVCRFRGLFASFFCSQTMASCQCKSFLRPRPDTPSGSFAHGPTPPHSYTHFTTALASPSLRHRRAPRKKKVVAGCLPLLVCCCLRMTQRGRARHAASTQHIVGTQ